jgi:hypothetical protein
MKAQLVPVNSSAIASVAYNERKNTLHVVFNSGTRYVYKDVPFVVVMSMLAADSIGRYFVYNVRNVYSFSRKG